MERLVIWDDARLELRAENEQDTNLYGSLMELAKNVK